MLTRNLRLVLLVAAAAACVQSRPSRNGVFNENQYLRKDFIIQKAGSTTPDPGWWLQGSITQMSSPNALGSDFWQLSPGINTQPIPIRFVVTPDKLQMVSTREIAADNPLQPTNTAEVVNAWPAANVDLMYQVNLDGETTNFYQENQERPWEQREWVKLNLDKNDMSDMAPFGEIFQNYLSLCVDNNNVTTTLVPDSFFVDEPNNYLEWSVQITLPLNWEDPNCVASYSTGAEGNNLGAESSALGRYGVTLTLKYSLMRQKSLPNADGSCSGPFGCVTYKPMVTDEKDGMHHKYGWFGNIIANRDPASGLLAAAEQVERWDPQKPINYYFAKGFNPAYKHFFTDPGTGVVDRANAILAAANVPARVHVYEYDENLAPGQRPREYGDIRYNFLNWVSDKDVEDFYAGVTIPVPDYRTGELLTGNITFNDNAFQDNYVQRINAYLLSIGASDDVNSPGEWPATPTITDQKYAAPNCTPTSTPNSCPLTLQNSDGTTTSMYCVNGSTLPIQSVVDAAIHNGTSTVFGKMQQYMGRPTSVYGSLGPKDFIATPSTTNDTDFFNAYYQFIQYKVYADPTMNQYTIPEGGNGTFGPPADNMWDLLTQEAQFQKIAKLIDSGQEPFDSAGSNGGTGLSNAVSFINQFRSLHQAHQEYQRRVKFSHFQQSMMLDGIDSLSFEAVADQAARGCMNGQWETKEQWVTNSQQAYWGRVMFHEFGHALGLQHNFMASIDQPNYPTTTIGDTQIPTMHMSSIMEYESGIDRTTFVNPDFGPYDKGAIAWIYANTAPDGTAPSTTAISGQTSPTSPWKDPLGFNADGSEKHFLMCYEPHLQYTPLCHQSDIGRTPSEIVANQLDAYEWQYMWRNFRSYHKFWDDSPYANYPAGLFTDLQRFLALWTFDWSSSEVADTLRRIGIQNPDPTVQSAGDYYEQLAAKFDSEISAANQMTAAYAEAMIQQSSGERPLATIYDPFYGDVVQQGIILDKYFAMQNFAGLWPVTNFDPSQAAGVYLANYEGYWDDPYNVLSQSVVVSMVGGGYDVYPYFVPLAVAMFAQDTHDPAFGNPQIRNWIGGKEFGLELTFLEYWQNLAQQNSYTGPGCMDDTGKAVACDCSPTLACNYDPRLISDNLLQFTGPDQRRYIWTYIADRNQWVVAEEDENIVTWQLLNGYNSDVNVAMDDGSFPGLAFSGELPIKYTVDGFTYFN
jgi:hypothetical protein